jgi:His-Xaa-Ser system protein HxsD
MRARLLARDARGRSRAPLIDPRSPKTSPELDHFDPAKGQMTLSLDAGLYPIEVLYGAAFVLLDRAYVLLDRDGEEGRNSRYLVHLRAKSPLDEAGLRALAGEFGNELLTQALRRLIVKQNGNLIEDITTRALAGAAGGSAPVDFLEDDDGLDFLDDPLGIAVPWEEKYHKKGGGNP